MSSARRNVLYFIMFLCYFQFAGSISSLPAKIKAGKSLLSALPTAQILRKGDSLLSKGLSEQAYLCFQSACRQSINERDSSGILLATAGMARADIKRLEWGSAINHCNEAKTLAESMRRKKDLLYARILFNLGRSYHEAGIDGNRHYLDSAFHYYNLALELRKKNKMANRKALAENYFRLGSLLFYDLTDYEQAERKLLQAWETYKRNGDILDPNFGRTNYILASLNRTIGDLERAISFATEANRIFSHPEVNKQMNALFSQIVLANTYYDENQYQNAITWYQTVISKAIDLFGSDAPVLINFYNNYAAALIETGQVDSAQRYLKKAIRINHNNPPVDYENLAFSYLHLADCAEKSRHPDLELSYLRLCLKTRKDHLSGNRHQIYQSIRFIGEFYERSNLPDTALRYYQQALQVLFPGFRDDDISSNPDFSRENREDVFYILYDKARVFLKRYFRDKNPADLQNAYTLYLTGDRMLEDARNSGFFEESKLLFNELFKKDLDAGILCAYQFYTLTKEEMYIESLFRLIEKSKYMLLLHSLIKTGQKTTLGIPDSLKTRERELDQRINLLKYQLASVSGSSAEDKRRAKWNHQLLSAINARDQLQKTLSAAYPEHYELIYDSTLISLKETQQQLKRDNQQILEYYWGDTMAIILSIYPDTTVVTDIRITKKLKGSLNDFTSILTGKMTGNNPSENFKTYISSADLLFHMLVKPGLRITKTSDVRHLIIIPDGPLALLPFEAFLTTPVASGFIDYAQLPYFIKNRIISYGYSVNLFFKTHPGRAGGSTLEILAMSYSGPEITLSEQNRRAREMEIPWSEKELRLIRKHLNNGTFLFGTNATEYRFKKLAPQSRIIHLAVHGIADEQNAMNSRLEFKSGGDADNDGKLYNYELYDLNLRNTRLAVLSACETGIGKQYPGEGIYSIARAFYYAGCPAIVMSLWKVNDKYTAGLMDLFYENISENKSADLALHDAKCTFLKTAGELEAHPANWASFIVIGKTLPFHNKDHTFLYMMLALTLVTVSAVFFFFKRKKGYTDPSS